ncbi:PEP-CTERM sorting domain-containing protein [Paludisphaera mucosa]|uniref:PEP-CTERM sorting domain-containing protein n=1 Tax=Paludisphaera mucosa TaxID=3030827 RepID=A0ABT6F8B5_9BACT|nr:PEP-CTERM sorting domain-containing protein [Paludisphaera mucosa]MDG3003826.1 PEP-CTERM sorting domain-containing protein [Paludisphaera mucosa]
MSHIVHPHRFRWIVAIGLLALAPAVEAAPLRGYTLTDLGFVPGTGLDNDGNVIDQPVRTLVGDVPTFDLGWDGGSDPRLPPGRVIRWAEVVDGTPDGRFLIYTQGAGSPSREIMQTFVADPNNPHVPSGLWVTLRLHDDYWSSIRGTDVNASGEVIGELGRIGADGHTTMRWDPRYFYAAAGETTIHELAELLPPGSGWRHLSLQSINDNGQILGWGVNPEGESSRFILTPNAVPEPGTWAIFGLASAAVGWRTRRRKR